MSAYKITSNKYKFSRLLYKSVLFPIISYPDPYSDVIFYPVVPFSSTINTTRTQIPSFCWHFTPRHQAWEPPGQQQLCAQGALNRLCGYPFFMSTEYVRGKVKISIPPEDNIALSFFVNIIYFMFLHYLAVLCFFCLLSVLFLFPM